MKKLLLSLAFVTSGLLAFNASAQQPANANAAACCQNKAECCKAKDGKGEKCCKQQKGKGHHKPGHKVNEFEGLNLTAEQQSALDALKANRNQARAEKRKEMKGKDKEARKEALKDARQQARQSRVEYLNEIKKILTPEQYVKYLENSYLKQGNPAARPGHKKGHKGPKGHKKPAAAPQSK